MKTFVSVPVTMASSRAIRQPIAVPYKLTSKRSWLKRFQHFVETTDWDEKYLGHKVIDEICFAAVILSGLYFVPVLVTIVLK